MIRVAVLGNGLSISCDASFHLDQLTHEVREHLDSQPLGDVSLAQHLIAIGERLANDAQIFDPSSDFERLLGPLDRIAILLRREVRAALTSVDTNPELAVSLGAIGERVRNLHERGVAVVLGVIDGHVQSASDDSAQRLVRWITHALAPADRATLYTVSYDFLLDRACLAIREAEPDRFSLADEFDGREHEMAVLLRPPLLRTGEIHEWRDGLWTRDRALDVVHLHGGQHWLRRRDDTTWKAKNMADIRGANLYGAWTNGDERAQVRPNVVLTDQKTSAVLSQPFAESYARLARDLVDADQVLVAGYGWGDVPLNEKLAIAWRRRHGAQRWLIVDRCAEADLIAKVGVGLACSADSIPPLSNVGIPDVTDGEAHFWA